MSGLPYIGKKPLPMYKPSTHLVITYFFTILLYMRPVSYRIGYQGETKY
jgi:hypothetical protein